MNTNLKTSDEWLVILKSKNPGFELLDPDGWDRKNYDYSFYDELISADEFNIRILRSTVSGDITNINNITL